MVVRVVNRYYLNGDRTVLRTMAILINEPLQLKEHVTDGKFSLSPVEDKLFSMNVGCYSSLGSICTVKVVEDTQFSLVPDNSKSKMIYCLDSAWYELPMAKEGRICTAIELIRNATDCHGLIYY